MVSSLKSRYRYLGLLVLTIIAAGMLASAQAQNAFIARFHNVSTISTTVPNNGDLNPYGLVRVPVTMGSLVKDRFLVSNFNNSSNQQGTGTSIVQIAADGSFTQFAQLNAGEISCPGGVGLTTALVALRSGFVVVGSLPTSDGTAATARAGCLIVLDSMGNVVETWSENQINGPWDMTAVDGGHIVALFVTNVLNGTVAGNGMVVNQGTVLRLLINIPRGGIPQLVVSTVIGSGFSERTDPAALVIGPTGVAFNLSNGSLYVADSLNNRIAAIHNALIRNSSAGTGTTVSEGGDLNDPLGMTLAPDGHILTANGNDGNIVETEPRNGNQVAAKLVDSSGSPPGAGALFGLTAASNGVLFVDDATNTLNLLH
jgi:DNA-binding beta-propeller fold protein YncE